MSRSHPIHVLHHLTQDLDFRSHAEQAELACRAGVRWVQCRIKNRVFDAWLAIAKEVQAVCNSYGACFIVNDNVKIASILDADGVHLGLSDMPIDQARNILGNDKIIGGTANTVDHVRHRVDEGADYIGLGPFRFTKTKTGLSPVISLKTYQSYVKEAGGIPVIAIGGIKAEDVASIINSGLHGLAVSSAINLADAPSEAASQFLKQLDNLERMKQREHV